MSRIIPELRHLDYPGRLRILKITTLETRRVRADLLDVFKIINGLDSIFRADFFIMENEDGKKNGSSIEWVNQGMEEGGEGGVAPPGG